MGGMKDEAKRITIPPLFSRVHVNDTRKGGISQPFDGKSMPQRNKRSNVFDSPSTLSLSIPLPPNKSHLISQPENNQFSPFRNTSPPSKFEEEINKKSMNFPSTKGSSITSSMKQNEYHFKKLTNSDLLKIPIVKPSETDAQANTDLSLLLSNESQNESFRVMEAQNISDLKYETQKKSKNAHLREQDVSDCSAIESLSGMSASSCDLARLIGEKRFWKMRTYMINQQRIFAAQVFELHRLITVQKMFAKSPNLILERKYNGGKRSTSEMVASKVKKTNNVTHHKPINEEYLELMKPKLPLSSLSKEFVTPIWQQQNQWLVPVMSPSEGLIYKPYAGPCPPPSSAFMVPMFGEDSLETALRIHVAPQFNHHNNYFPPKTTKVNPFGQFQRLSSTSSHMTQAIPFSKKKSQDSNESEADGSTASSPPEEKRKFDVLLPLFPTEPTHQTEHVYKKQAAIKAVPHNPTSASESAARIFRCIQEERRDSNHMIS